MRAFVRTMRLVAIGLALALAACGGGDDKDVDGGWDGGTDSDSDSDSDSDTDTDSDSDTDTDTDTDADSDTDTDTDADAGADGGGDGGEWEGCPDSGAYIGDDAWENSLEATASAIYCGTFDESRTLAEELAAKAMLRVVEGVYPLPLSDVTAPFSLPICFERAEGASAFAMSGAGEAVTTHSGTTEIWYHLDFEQPVDDTASATDPYLVGWASYFGPPSGPADPVVLTGGEVDIYGTDHVSFTLCHDPDACYAPDDIQFDACAPTTYVLNRHTVVFDGGDIVLDLEKGFSMASTEPAAFVAASGELDGTPFSQLDYFALIYNPTHHHFSRDFAVLFDAPIEGACGIAVIEATPWSGDPWPTVSTVNCDLSMIETRIVSGYTFELP